MPKQLVLTVAINLPDGMFEQAERINDAKEPFEELVGVLETVGGCDFTHKAEIIDSKAPRARRSDAGTKRAPKTLGDLAQSLGVGEP